MGDTMMGTRSHRPTYEELEERIRQLEKESASRKEGERPEAIRSKEEWDRTFDAVPDLIAILDDQHRIVRANKAMADALGCTPDETVGMTCYRSVHGTEAPPAFCPHTRLLADGQMHTVDIFEERLGGYFNVSVSPIHDGAGRLVGSVHIARDITDRKRVENALRENENKYRTLLEYLPQKIFLKDPQSVYVSCNDNYARDLGIAAEQIAGRTDHDFYHRELAEKYRRDDQRLMELGETEDIEERYVQHGEERWVHTVKTPIVDEKGHATGILGIFWDITDLKRAEEAVRQGLVRRRREAEVVAAVAASRKLAEGVLKELAVELTEAASVAIEVERVGVWLFEEGGRRLVNVDNYVASTGEHSSGAVLLEQEFQNEFDALKSSKYVDAHDPLTDPRTAGYVEGYLKPNRITSMLDAVIRSGDRILGTLCFEHVDKPHHWEDDEIAFACQLADQVALAVSNRERKGVEERLKLERKQLLSIFDSIDEIIYVSDTNTYEILYANQKLKDAFQRNLVGGICYREFQGLDSPCPFCTNHIISQKRHVPYRWVYHNPILKRDYAVIDQLITWPDGRDVRFELALDITDQKRLEAQLRQAQKMEAVGTLAGGIAHDFNNLLQAILGYSEILMMNKGQSDPDLSRLQGIERAAGRASELTRQLLAFSRKVESKLRPVDLNQEVRQVEKLLKRTIPKMIGIELHLQEGVRLINADPAQMEQILMNLGVNARDAMPEGGKLVIETQNATLDQEFCKTYLGAVPGEYVLITVSDTGHGMDKETVEHIFEPFFTTKGPGKGTGLGLSMVYGIVKNHRGTIACYSEPGQGTTFRIYLPAIEEENLAAPLEKEGAKEQFPRGSETILLVDDEVFLREIGRDMLERFGYEVILADTGERAIEVFETMRESISLIILDLIMPGMGGVKCLEKLLGMDPGVKVVIASGYSVTGPAQKALDAGAKGFINKPYQLGQMLNVVRDVLDKAPTVSSLFGSRQEPETVS